MNKNTLLKGFLVLAFVFTLLPLNSSVSYAGDEKKDKPFMKEVEKMRLKKKNGIFNLNLDIQLGANIANTTFEFNKVDTLTQKLTASETKVGPAAGLILSMDFLGFGLTTGMTYSSKGFKTTDGTGTTTNTNLNYFNIPLLLYFDFDLGKVLVDGNIGPYFGLLLSQDQNTLYNVKNFDFGLTGAIQGAYMLNKYMGPLLGVKYEYGGLNNLGSNETIKSIRTSTIFIYTGFKFVL